jgi:hypothetical protein
VYDFVPGIPDADVAELIGSAECLSGRPFVSLDWLKRMKAASSRPKDRQDLLELP